MDFVGKPFFETIFQQQQKKRQVCAAAVLTALFLLLWRIWQIREAT